jgi:PAS domain S-box-containing protein
VAVKEVVTVLVVDDNPATLYATSRVLRAAGFHVREAKTGRQALEMAEDSPDAVLLDVNLPDIDGFEVCKILRGREKNASTPIIHLSATFVGALDKVQGLESGADGYLTQPVEPPVLVATLNAFLRTRNAEESMRRSEEKFRAIFDQAVNGIALMSSELVYLEVNPSLCRILGRDRGDIIGVPLSAFAPPGFEKQETAIDRDLSLRGVWSGPLPLMRGDGRRVELDWHISFHPLPAMRLAEVTDTTHRHAEEAEREYLLESERLARTDAERANRLKDEFLATISHELRSPLNAIVGWAHVLKKRKGMNINDIEAGIDAIDRNAKLQSQLISDLLDVSSIIAGKMRLNLQQIELANVIQHSVEAHVNTAAAKSITIESEIDPLPAIVSGDPGRLQQVMANLLTNAIKFTPPGGHVLVRLVGHEGPAQISVTDSGKGISAQFLPHIFDTFRQEQTGTTRVHEGLGLGLAIVKRLVEMHGGTVAAYSEGPSKGSTFTITLPLAGTEAKELGEMDQGPPNLEVLRGLRVLLVDDDADARGFVRRILSDHAAIVGEAESYSEAVRLLQLSAPQILISDIGMPGHDGYELIRQVRQLGYDARRLPAIAVTALARSEDRARVLSSGYAVHLSKPVDPEKLIATIAYLAGSCNSA